MSTDRRRPAVDPQQPHMWQPGGGHEDYGYAKAPLCRHCRQTLTQGPHQAVPGAS